MGFSNHIDANPYLSPQWSGGETAGHYMTMSLFAGCGGLDLGMTGGFEVLGNVYEPLPFRIVKAVDYLEDAVDTYRLNLGNEIELGDLREMDTAH